jgi:hypothetical protein
MGYKFYRWEIPDRMMEPIRRYIENGIKPGDFLTAVIENNLSEAVGNADYENLENLQAFVGYFYNKAPAACWGSPEKVKKWIDKYR